MNQSAAKRSLLLLECLSGHPAGLPLNVICEAIALPKSIAHRLLALLAEAGYVQQAEGGRYALTLKLTMLGLRHYVQTGLDNLAQPVLDRLARDSGELARLALVEGERLVWVAKAQGARTGLRYDPEVDHDTGHDVVLHATAAGKAWLATLPEAEALRIVAATGLQTPARFGPRVARTLDDVSRRLVATRAAGYGEALEEGEPGTAAVAVAVRGGAGRVVGTLSLAGPVVRFGAERRPQLAERLHAAAAELAQIWPLQPHAGPAVAGRGPARAQPTEEEERHERGHHPAL